MDTPLQGSLSLYAVPGKTHRKYPFFTTGSTTASRAVIFIGGLFNGLGDVPYLPTLSGALGEAGWRLVLFHWSSAYEGFGTGSLDRDRDEIAALVAHLRTTGVSTIVLMGHSTGSQDVIHYLTTRSDIEGGIMQAPMSDREFIELNMKEWVEMLPGAEELVKAGKGEEALDVSFIPNEVMKISAYRLWSLVSPSGDDDYFTTDLPLTPDGLHAHPLSTSFGALSAPALALYSEKDEYSVPAASDPSVHLNRWKDASKGKLEWKVVAGATHAVEGKEEQVVLSGNVVDWLKSQFGA